MDLSMFFSKIDEMVSEVLILFMVLIIMIKKHGGTVARRKGKKRWA